MGKQVSHVAPHSAFGAGAERLSGNEIEERDRLGPRCFGGADLGHQEATGTMRPCPDPQQHRSEHDRGHTGSVGVAEPGQGPALPMTTGVSRWRSRFGLLALAVALVGGAVVTPSLFREPDGSGSPIAASYPEGPLHQGTTLYYGEMGADRVSRAVGAAAPTTFFSQPGCGPTAISPYGAGFLVLCHLGRRLVETTTDGQPVREWQADATGRPLMDPNDGHADGRGGVYFSDPGRFSRESVPEGRVMHLSAGGELRSVAEPLWYPNGVFVDKELRYAYVSEHMAGRVLRFEIGADGSLGPPTTFVDLALVSRPERYDTPYAETGPDGLEIGPNGDLYVAIYGEGRVLRFAPDGSYRGAIELPTRYSTNISFAPDGSAVTTGAFNNDDPPLRGELRRHPAEALTR